MGSWTNIASGDTADVEYRVMDYTTIVTTID